MIKLKDIMNESFDNKIVKGMKMMNILGKVREVVKVSPAGISILAKNLDTGEMEHFRYYEASGKYIRRNSVDELGENWRYEQNKKAYKMGKN